jgi:hypothetical protein
MKKTPKKLMLSKETVRTLLDRELPTAQGGTMSAYMSCDYPCEDEFTTPTRICG